MRLPVAPRLSVGGSAHPARIRRAVLFGLLIGAMGCHGLSEALTAHVDVAARAGNEELSTTRLATLVGQSRAPVQKEFVRQLAQLWVDYQLLGHAAALGDSLHDPKLEDQALWPIYANAKATRWTDTLTKRWLGGDTVNYGAKYAHGESLAAWHILLMPPKGDTSAAKLDSVRRAAVALRAKVTPTNFADLARKNSQDPGSASRGGDLGVFGRGQMVPDFERALLALQPGQISQPVKTQFGYHLIYRPTYAQVKDNFEKVMQKRTIARAESLYVVSLDSASRMRMAPTALATTRAVAKDLDAHTNDQTVVVTTADGNVTAADLAKWFAIFPTSLRLQIPTAPDSALPGILRNIVRNETMLHQADSAHITLDSADVNGIRRSYTELIVNAWTQLGVDSKDLADSAKTVGDRERLAAAHVESYLNRLLAPTPSVRFVDIPQPLENVLRAKFESSVSETGLDRALARATDIRRRADSARAAKEPTSAIPLPGGMGARPAPQKPPQP